MLAQIHSRNLHMVFSTLVRSKLFGRVITSALMTILATGAADADSSGLSTLEPDRIRWQQLHFEAAKLLVSGKAEVGFELLAADATLPTLTATPDGTGRRPRGPEIGRLQVTSQLGGRETRESVWLDPGDGAALERRKLKVGSSGYARTERFAAAGIHRTRRSPANDAERQQPSDTWSQEEVGFQPFDGAIENAPIVHPLALFYLISAARLEAAGDRLEVAIASRGKLVPIALEVLGREELKVDYEAVRGDETTEHRGPMMALRVRIAEGGGGDGDFRFLGLKDGIEIWLDPASRVPVLVRGRMSFFGRVDVVLKQVEMKTSTGSPPANT